ncbi:MAG TPA: ribonuclease III [Bacillota bacterium]|nr:ribonuclease III [Bacillota bacterium]
MPSLQKMKPLKASDLTELKKALGLFTDQDQLLQTALNHCSYANERSCQSNERLEFLGDAVLSIILSHYLFTQCRREQEGYLTRLRAMLVNEDCLAYIARGLNLGDYLRLSGGEQKNGGRTRKSILADAMEAVIGAVYLQYGFETAQSFVLTRWEERLNQYLSGDRPIDAKTVLQEKLQSRGKKPEYHLLKVEGPDHDRLFTTEVMVDGVSLGIGTGQSKKDAEQLAAAEALRNLPTS